jgi:N-acetylgalactosamine-N,N'-diacetylbacillosaminyl-diphospho-undecaprenol 4-alpha-N-acetylgalactosaminyltransferase
MLRPLELGEIPHGDLPSVPIVSGDLPPSRRYLYRLPALTARLVREARRSDLVMAAWEVGEPFVAALFAAKAARRPVVTSVQSYAFAELDHYYGKSWLNAATRWGYPRTDAVVCASDGLLEVVASMGVRRDRTRVIRSGVDVARTRALATEPPPAWVPSEPFLVGVGRLAEHKGFDLLVRAHAAVLAEGLPHRLVILGQGERERELRALVEQLDVSDTVMFPGFMANPFPVVARAAAMCGPSRYEGWGRMLAEALALGVPVIASDLAGPSTILAGGQYGDLIEPGSADALAAAVSGHLADPARLAAKAIAGRANSDSFSNKGRAQGFARLFEEMLAKS